MKYILTISPTQECLDLRNEVFIVEQGFKPEDEWDDDASIFYHLHLYESDSLIAYLRIQNDNGVAHIGRVLVRKDKRKQHYGFKIMKMAEEVIKHLGLSEAYLHAQVHAVGFYERCGFEKKGNSFEEAGATHYLMIKHI